MRSRACWKCDISSAPATQFTVLAKRNHDHHVGKAHLLAHTLQCTAFQDKACAVTIAVIACGTAQADHWIFLLGLELGAAGKAGIPVGLEIAGSHNHGKRVTAGGDPGDALS